MRLFLDDIRTPNSIFPQKEAHEWTTATNYEEFCSIVLNEIPTHISFDHDLYDQGENIGEFQIYTVGKTGVDCALFLIHLLMHNDTSKEILEQMKVFVHSANESGAKNIKAYWDSYFKINDVNNFAVLINPLERLNRND